MAAMASSASFFESPDTLRELLLVLFEKVIGLRCQEPVSRYMFTDISSKSCINAQLYFQWPSRRLQLCLAVAVEVYDTERGWAPNSCVFRVSLTVELGIFGVQSTPKLSLFATEFLKALRKPGISPSERYSRLWVPASPAFVPHHQTPARRLM